MIAFAYIDEKGIPTGGGIRRELPEGAVPLDSAFTTTDLPRLRFQDGTWVERDDLPPPSVPTPQELAELRAFALARARTDASLRINGLAGELRLRIYTDIPGQDALYLEKRAEAVAYVAEARGRGEPASLTNYPLLENELGVTAPTAWTLAQLWLNRSDQFKRVGAATERLRMQALIAIASASSFDALEAIERDFTEALSRLPL
ncbi:hypothetical protein [Tabrizicola sp.]|uniref:hypothetical protein n=1 Tax=Tabrizicola sp. TaxID=2005166 RepID=UPI0025D8872E|nr:hypothetical protein [Tabrizicola sp.]